jgi:hypothetical protein
MPGNSRWDLIQGLRVKRGNWFTGHLATQSMWSGAGTVFVPVLQFFPINIIPSKFHADV